jgi:carboxypeptidase Taq
MKYVKLQERVGELNDLLNAQSVLTWDARVMMPQGGNETRSKQLATLSVLTRNLLVGSDTRSLLEAAEMEVAKLEEASVEATMVRQVREAFNYNQAFSADLIRRRAELSSIGFNIWAKARAANDFSQYAPFLKEMVALSREMAEAIGYKEHPYDALLYLYDPEDTVSSLKLLFARLREALVPLVRAISEKPEPRTDFLERKFPAAKQQELSLNFARAMGYDFERGRLDTTLHPFEVSLTRNDVRITTRYMENSLSRGLFATLHELGHALYEQGIDPAYTRSIFATDLVGLYAVGGASYGAHEAQARLWENLVGRARPFWNVHFDTIREVFPEQLSDVSVEEFWRAVNRVRPDVLRLQADELTYDLHIMLRVEIESALIEGSLEVEDLPRAWNAKIREYLGLEVPNDANGLMQDFHWSSGFFGNFSNYTAGNVMACQLFETAKRIDSVAQGLEEGNYAALRQFMSENIYVHGRRYSRNELLVRATGRTLDPEPYIAYLTAKYSELYDL